MPMAMATHLSRIERESPLCAVRFAVGVVCRFGDVFEGDFVAVRGVVFFFDFVDFDGILFADEGFIGDAIASEAMGDRLGKIKKETGKW